MTSTSIERVPSLWFSTFDTVPIDTPVGRRGWSSRRWTVFAGDRRLDYARRRRGATPGELDGARRWR